MPEKMTQADLDNLADIIWWIKGFHDARTWTADSSPFGSEHIEALRKARVILMEKVKGDEAFVPVAPKLIVRPFKARLDDAIYLIDKDCARVPVSLSDWPTLSAACGILSTVNQYLAFIETGEI